MDENTNWGCCNDEFRALITVGLAALPISCPVFQSRKFLHLKYNWRLKKERRSKRANYIDRTKLSMIKYIKVVNGKVVPPFLISTCLSNSVFLSLQLNKSIRTLIARIKGQEQLLFSPRSFSRALFYIYLKMSSKQLWMVL